MKRQSIWSLILLCVGGCAAHRGAETNSAEPSAQKAPTTQPILYHRSGGIAGTDDRVVIWPDGFVQVNGKLLNDGTAMLAPQRITDLAAMFNGWSRLKDSYRAANIMDAYVITIEYGGKSVTVDDVAPEVPAAFRKLITEIEAIAADASETTERGPAGPIP